MTALCVHWDSIFLDQNVHFTGAFHVVIQFRRPFCSVGHWPHAALRKARRMNRLCKMARAKRMEKAVFVPVSVAAAKAGVPWDKPS